MVIVNRVVVCDNVSLSQMAGFRQQAKRVSSEKTEMSAVLMKNVSQSKECKLTLYGPHFSMQVHHQFDVHQQHMKTLCSDS